MASICVEGCAALPPPGYALVLRSGFGVRLNGPLFFVDKRRRRRRLPSFLRLQGWGEGLCVRRVCLTTLPLLFFNRGGEELQLAHILEKSERVSV